MNNELEIVKKAWKVMDPTVYEWSDWVCADNVYADTRGEAKRQCSDYKEYVNIKARRAKGNDLVLYQGREMKRWLVADEIKSEERAAKMGALPDGEMFYVQDSRSYVGNSVLWWGLNGNGYTTDITKAHKYTKEEVIKQFAKGRETDRVWIASHVEENIRQHVDMQYLKKGFAY